MLEIIKEKRRPWTWYFDDGWYLCIDQNGEIRKKILGVQWPDPMKINAARQQVIRELPPEQRVGFREYADPITIAIWDDYQKRLADSLNSTII